MKLCLNLACGMHKKESNETEQWINIDNNKECEPDMIRDITRGLPFLDNSIDLIHAEHILEHLETDDFIFFFNECWRVLKLDAELVCFVPYMFKKWAFIDPTHRRLLNEFSFDFFTNKDYNSITAGVTGWYIPVAMDITEGELSFKMKKTLNPDHYVFTTEKKFIGGW